LFLKTNENGHVCWIEFDSFSSEAILRTSCMNLGIVCYSLKVNFYGPIVPAGFCWLQGGDTF